MKRQKEKPNIKEQVKLAGSIYEKIKKAKKVKFYLKDKVLRIYDKDTELGEEDYHYKPGVDILAHLYILMREGIKFKKGK